MGSTPGPGANRRAELGAVVREARSAAQLTQADLARRAGVSREWLIGLERGTRPRAELTKILDVLSALDQPIMVGREQKPDVPQNESESAQRTNAMTTDEVTRRAIEQSRQPSSRGPFSPSASAVLSARAAEDVSAEDRQWSNRTTDLLFVHCQQVETMLERTT